MVAIRSDKSLLFSFCGPGASGKSTICREVAAKDKTARQSISTTTRLPRGNEQNGVEYYFVSDAEFENRVAAGKMLEHAVFGGKRYGTEKVNLESAERDGVDLLFDIEFQGAAQLKTLFPDRAVTIFVFPPSFEVLEQRFRSRGTDDEARIQARLKIAEEEIRQLSAPGFSDYFIVNDNLDESIRLARSLIDAERLRFSRISTEQRKKILGC